MSSAASKPTIADTSPTLEAFTTDTPIGFVGMGLMGVPMSARLSEAGFPVTVWNRNAEKLQNDALAAASKAQDLAALCEQSTVVMLCVSDTAAVEQVVFGENGLVNYLTNKHVVVDFSSIAPDATRHFAERLVQTCGAQWVDAPVSGGVAGAEAGTLAIMTGGPEALVDQLRPVLEPLSQRVTRMGDVGSGQATKVCNQMLVSCNVMVMAEVLAMAEKAGVNTELLPAALKGGFADSIPLQLSGTRMAKRELDEVKWHVKTLLKDMDLASDLASSCDAETPMSDLARSIYQAHGDSGFLEKDPATLIQRYIKDAD